MGVLLEAGIEAARLIGLRFHPARSSMNLGKSPGVAHCPTSNGRLGSGIPLAALIAAGAPVGLGVDGAASNESGRMVDELHEACWQHGSPAGREALQTVRRCGPARRCGC